MVRLSRVAHAALAFFGILCLNSKAASASSGDAAAAFDASGVGADAEVDLGLREGDGNVQVETESPSGYDGKLLADEPAYGDAEAAIPEEGRKPKLMGVKSTVLGFIIVFGFLALALISHAAGPDSPFTQSLDKMTGYVDDLSERMSVRGQPLHPLVMAIIGGVFALMSGVADLLRSSLRRRAARSGIYTPPPVRGLEVAVLGLLSLVVVYLLLANPLLLLLAYPAILVGGLLNLHSLRQRRKYIKELLGRQKEAVFSEGL